MMIGRLVLAMLLVIGTAGMGVASEIQCKRILKYLSTGRTPTEIAETMVISEDDVIACQEEAAEEAGAEAADAPAEGGDAAAEAPEEAAD
jgi:hypothetical protein